MRSIVTAAVAAQLLLGALPASAQDAYPARTVQMVVPYPAGGTVDPLVRIDPAVKKLLTDQGAESPPMSLAQLRDYVHNEIELYGAIVRAGDMKAD